MVSSTVAARVDADDCEAARGRFATVTRDVGNRFGHGVDRAASASTGDALLECGTPTFHEGAK